jgi:hypothetical protein
VCPLAPIFLTYPHSVYTSQTVRLLSLHHYEVQVTVLRDACIPQSQNEVAANRQIGFWVRSHDFGHNDPIGSVMTVQYEIPRLQTSTNALTECGQHDRNLADSSFQ